MSLRTPWTSQPQFKPLVLGGGFAWLGSMAGLSPTPGRGGLFVSPSAATTVGTYNFCLSKTFTVVTVYANKDASQAQTEVFRIGAGSTGVRWDFATTAGGANPDTWTLNGVANGTNQLRSVVFDTRPRVNVASFDAATFEVTSGELGGADLLSYVQTASMIAPSDGSVIVRGGPIQFYGIFILPYRISRARAVELVRNPWQLVAPDEFALFAPSAAGGGSTGTVAYTNANDTSAASGTTTIVGTLARTNANDTSAANGTTTVLGTLAKTNANDTVAASGTTTVTGTLATTNANDTCAASGTVGSSGSTGTVNVTNANDTVAASGTTTVAGTLARTNTNDTASAAGWVGTITGTLAYTNADDSASASGAATAPVTAVVGGGGWLPHQARRKTRKEVHAERIRLGILPPDIVKAAVKVAVKAETVAEFKADRPRYEEMFMRELQITKWSPDYTRAIQAQLEIIEQEEEDILLLM